MCAADRCALARWSSGGWRRRSAGSSDMCRRPRGHAWSPGGRRRRPSATRRTGSDRWRRRTPPLRAGRPRRSRRSGPSAAVGEQGGVPVEVERPTGVVSYAVADCLPAWAVPVEVAVLELDPGALRVLRDEADLDLAGVLRLGLDLPRRADVPAEHDPLRWLVDQHAGPVTLAAVGAAVVDVAADPRFEDGLGDWRREQVALGGLKSPKRSVKTTNAFSTGALTTICRRTTGAAAAGWGRRARPTRPRLASATSAYLQWRPLRQRSPPVIVPGWPPVGSGVEGWVC